MKRMIALVAVAAALVAATPASAHITLEAGKATIGSAYKAVLRVPHGCSGEATTAIHVQVPEGFISAKPMPKPGWKIDIVTGAYAKPYDYFGSELKEGVTEIVWSGGELPDAYYDEFVFRGTFAGSLEAGKVFFPVIQTCTKGEESWIDTSGDENAEFPAPSVDLVPDAP